MADTNQIKCPHCGQTYAVRPEQWGQYNGRTINCTKCGQTFTVAAPAEMAAAPQPPAVGQPGVSQAIQPPPMGTQPPAMAYASPAGFPMGAVPVAPTQGNGWAITSLIFGIISFCVPVVLSLVAIVTGIIGVVKTRDPRVRGKGSAVAGITLGAISFLIMPLLISILLPSLNRAREQANRVKCAANMRQLGVAMMMYANTYNNHFPEKLEEVLQAGPTLPATAFICPDDDKTPPSTSSLQTEQSEIASGKHCSYIYTGGDLTASASPDTVLLYEPLTNHLKEGGNVLFADGHVEWFKAKEIQNISAQHAAGNGPIKLSSP